MSSVRVHTFITAALLSAATTVAALASTAAAAQAAEAAGGAVPAHVVVQAAKLRASRAFDGVVQAVRQTTMTAQVAGAVVELRVKAGDSVRAGQLLLRLDARAADQTAAAGSAQFEAARAAEVEAQQELSRQRQLFEKSYISRSALERAEARYQSARASALAQRAAAGASRTQSAFYLVTAPYDAVVTEVPVELGDMALPGRPLLRLYDPAALRVSTKLPQSAAASLPVSATPRLQLGSASDEIQPTALQWLPVADPGTHTVELRLDLPAGSHDGAQRILPGSFARVLLPTAGGEGLFVPTAAIVRRAELSAVYVLDDEDGPRLRQVRVGRVSGDSIEVLSGLAEGERVLLDPAAAARQR